MRAAWRILGIVGALLLCLPLHYGWRLATGRSPWPRIFLAQVARIAGMRAHVEGQPLNVRVLFLANHVSWLDILLVAGASGAAFVSKAEVARWPMVGWLAALHGTIFVDRAERSAVRSQADTLRSALAGGKPVALFPEGTTSDGTGVLPFRASLLASLYPPLPDVQVQPVAIDYGAALGDIAWVGEEPALTNALRVLGRKSKAEVVLRFLDPLSPSEFADRKALAQAARSSILDALGASESRADRL